MTGFGDIFKKSFLEGFSGSITTIEIAIAILLTCFLALYVFFVYRLVTRKTFYSKTFNITLAGISVITAGIILAVQSSIVISLGMVGALSIVRFRTAIKDPMDLMFLFWSISNGIVCGAGLAEIGFIISLVLTAGIFLLDRLPLARLPMLLVLNASDKGAEGAVLRIVGEHCRYYKVKSKNYTGSRLDMVIEVRLPAEEDCLKRVSEVPGVESAALLSHDGEVTF